MSISISRYCTNGSFDDKVHWHCVTTGCCAKLHTNLSHTEVLEVPQEAHNHLVEQRDTKKAKFNGIVRDAAINSQKDPQEIVSDAYLAMGLDKELMASTTDCENIKRNIRKTRQKESNDPKNPQCRATFEIAEDFKSIKVTRNGNEEFVAFVVYDSALDENGQMKTDENGEIVGDPDRIIIFYHLLTMHC